MEGLGLVGENGLPGSENLIDLPMKMAAFFSPFGTSRREHVLHGCNQRCLGYNSMKLTANAAKPIGPNPMFKVHLPVPLIFRCEKVCFRECNTCFAYCFTGFGNPLKMIDFPQPI